MILSKFQMSKPIIIKLNYSVKDNFDEYNLTDYPTKLSIKSIYGNKDDNDDNVVFVYVDLTVNDKNSPYIIEMTIAVTVQWEQGIENDEIESILTKTIPAHLVSYARPIISVITSYSPYQQFNIPFVDFSNQESEYENNN